MDKAILNVGLGYGDEGKGTTVDFQTRQTDSKLTVRFNGGAQAAHNVVLADGRHHVFAQFGAATFNPGVKTFLSKFMLVNPLAMISEEKNLSMNDVTDAFDRMYIDGNALLTTPYHRADNRIKELARGRKMHGSCGMGISATVEDSLNRPDECLRVNDLLNAKKLKRKLELNRQAMMDGCLKHVIKGNPLMETEASTFDESLIDVLLRRYNVFKNLIKIVNDDQISELFRTTETVIFEPAQGVLLDENYGFHPYTTWTTTTLKNAYLILNELGFGGSVETFGILRTFGTRHGPGPFVTENEELTRTLADPYNTLNLWQKGFRCGWLDLVMLRYALEVNGPVDGFSITHVDWLNKRETWDVAVEYMLPDGTAFKPFIPTNMEEQIKLTELLGKVVPIYKVFDKFEILDMISRELKTPIKIVSHGPKPEDKIWTK